MKLRLFWFFLKPCKKLYAAIVVVMVVGGVLDGLSLAAFFPLLSTLASGTGDQTAGAVALIVRVGRFFSISDPIIAAAALLIVVFALKAAVGILRELLVARASRRHLFDLKNQILERYSRQRYQFFLDNKQGHLIYKGITSPARVCGLLLKLPQMVTELVKMIAIATVLLLVFPVGTVVLALLGFAYYEIIRYLSRKVSYNIGRERVQASEDEHAIANEFLNGMHQIMTFRAAESWLERLRAKIRMFANLHARDLVWNSVPKHVMELAAVTLMLSFLMILRFRGQVSLTDILPQFGVFGVGLVQLLPAVTGIGRMRMEIVGLLPDAEALHRSLTESIAEPEPGTKTFDSFDDAIVFDDVWFSHAEREPVLKGISIRIEKGQSTALVGTSGAGKSTLVNLILRLYEPSAGRILSSGLAINQYTRASWLSRIGYVSQDPFVFHATVGDNIRFGRDGYSLDEVIEAATTANAHDFISSLPDGYDTVVGERGMKLSGGQQQRLCIARALLEKPDILIFDEATSSLDSVSEALIQNTLARLSHDHTLLVIAHRQSTVASADKIFVLEGGHVVQQGTPEELMKDVGQYATLFGSSAI